MFSFVRGSPQQAPREPISVRPAFGPGHGLTPELLASRWSSYPGMNVIEFDGHVTDAEFDGHVQDVECFSNFYDQRECPFDFDLPPELDGIGLSPDELTVRCAFAEKAIALCKAAVSGDRQSYEKICDANSPGGAKALGRKVSGFKEDLWNDVVCSVAFAVVVQKFSKTDAIRPALLATGDAVLAEARENDHLWGVGLERGNPSCQVPSEWKGVNILGWALMETRAVLRLAEAADLDVEADFERASRGDEPDVAHGSGGEGNGRAESPVPSVSRSFVPSSPTKCHRGGCTKPVGMSPWCSLACQTVSQANTLGFDESQSYCWAYADSYSPLAKFSPLRYSKYLHRWELAEELAKLSAPERAVRVHDQRSRHSVATFESSTLAQAALTADKGLPANENGYDESPRFRWRWIYPAGPSGYGDSLPKVGYRAWSVHMSRSEMLAQFQDECYSLVSMPVEIQMKGREKKPARYDTLQKAEEALRQPLRGISDDAIQDLESRCNLQMDRCQTTRLLAKYGGDVLKASREFDAPPTPYAELVQAAGFAESPFRKEYAKNEAVPTVEALKEAVANLVEDFHVCRCPRGPERCRQQFLEDLASGLSKDDDVPIAAQRLWTSAVRNCADQELCGLINLATRTAVPQNARPVALLARAINSKLVTVDREAIKRNAAALEQRPGFNGTCFRGGSLPNIHKAFFEQNKTKKIRVPNYLATAFKDGEVVKGFLERAEEQGDPCVKWEIHLTSRAGRCYCTHVNFIENRTEGLDDEHEFLFVPYSVFTIDDVKWSRNPTAADPHVITMCAAEDNLEEENDLLLAPWS